MPESALGNGAQVSLSGWQKNKEIKKRREEAGGRGTSLFFPFFFFFFFLSIIFILFFLFVFCGEIIIKKKKKTNRNHKQICGCSTHTHTHQFFNFGFEMIFLSNKQTSGGFLGSGGRCAGVLLDDHTARRVERERNRTFLFVQQSHTPVYFK